MELIKNLEWRYATKKFDPSQKIKKSDLTLLKKSVQLSVSSYGLQLYKVLIIEDAATKERLKAASWNQSQITDASLLFVFCNYSSVLPRDIDEYIRQLSVSRQIPIENLEKYRNFMMEKINEKTAVDLKSWLEKQPYLALSNLLVACAELKIDACPMEGFDSAAYNKILNLEEQRLNACIIAPVGYRSPEDTTQFLEKVRKPKERLFEHI